MRVSIIENQLKLGRTFMYSFIFNLSSVNYGLFVHFCKTHCDNGDRWIQVRTYSMKICATLLVFKYSGGFIEWLTLMSRGDRLWTHACAEFSHEYLPRFRNNCTSMLGTKSSILIVNNGEELYNFIRIIIIIMRVREYHSNINFRSFAPHTYPVKRCSFRALFHSQRD